MAPNLILPLIGTSALLAAPGPEPALPRHGSLSRTPAVRWEDGFVTGNGRLGAMLFGEAGAETLVATHCRLFLPLGSREIVPDLAPHLAELRRIIREQGYTAAMAFLLGRAREQGFPGIIPTDPFHPALFVRILQPPTGPIRDYVRTEDFQTGEVTARWSDDRGRFERRFFASRTRNLIALSITGPAPCELQFPALEQPLIESHQTTGPEWTTWHNVYAMGKGGYDAVARVIRRDGGRSVTLLIRVAPWKTPLPAAQSEAWDTSPEHPDFRRPGVYHADPPLAASSVVSYGSAEEARALLPHMRRDMARLRADYAALLAPHAAAHRALFDRVALDLGGGSERQRTSEELLERAAREDTLPPALMERMYDAGRYMLICSAGELLPNLQGIWTGTWTPAWSGDFTLDTNVQAAMASACSANLLDLMEGYFRRMEGFYPEWRLNARRTYGCRGVFTNSRASNTALELHWGTWEGVFWTAGCGWLASFFTEYAAFTEDDAFLRTRCVPLLKEIALFYEDFLAGMDREGRAQFVPSYNPETGCGVSATMDVAVAREVLTNLLAACRRLGIEAESAPGWQALLARLPPYPVSRAGELAEWPGAGVDRGHRHHSQLYPCFQSFDRVFETDAALRRAAQASVRAKVAGSDRGGEQSSFGRVQAGVAAAWLGMGEEAFGRLKVMATKRSMASSMITTHEPSGQILNADGNGGIPQIVNTMLLRCRDDRLELLPALPAAWPAGSVRGLRARGGLTIDIAWSEGRVTDFRVTAIHPRTVQVSVNGETRSIQAAAR